MKALIAVHISTPANKISIQELYNQVRAESILTEDGGVWMIWIMQIHK
eukprot:Gb_14338 [translate_table: standard]